MALLMMGFLHLQHPQEGTSLTHGVEKMSLQTHLPRRGLQLWRLFQRCAMREDGPSLAQLAASEQLFRDMRHPTGRGFGTQPTLVLLGMAARSAHQGLILVQQLQAPVLPQR